MHAEIYARWLRSERATQTIIRNVGTNGSITHGQQTTVDIWSAGLRPCACRAHSLAISGTVTMAPSLASKGSATDTVFVFARETNGPPMPVAIVRATKKDLPFAFRLDDSTSMMPSRKLSDVGTVVIVARISKSGQAMPQSGDLEGTSQPLKPGASGVTVVIRSEEHTSE